MTPHLEGRLRPSRRAGATHDPLDLLDVAVVVSRQAPWQLAALQAALAADLSEEWCGGVLVVDDGAPATTARAARAALADHHVRARRTILTLPRRLGTTAAADLAMAEATGVHVALIDAATRPDPGTLRALTTALEDDHDALWAAPRAATGLAVFRRAGFLDLGGFDPELRGTAAVTDLARRATIEGRRLLTVPDAGAHRDGRADHGASRRFRGRGTRPEDRATPPHRRPWSGSALALWLPRARRAVVREDLV
ncbi:MAG TPA: glycosyltransferase [Baekduia sp.]|uniref:glycosyltransferase n=1 Tax=Baekduia sp. TaxID=2600305 RepID=UPI002D7701D4|nr:glycosyltransferase [Baekduia sp.]HET6507154.1 glycosyltransferase [Baekduia sp.]